METIKLLLADVNSLLLLLFLSLVLPGLYSHAVWLGLPGCYYLGKGKINTLQINYRFCSLPNL